MPAPLRSPAPGVVSAGACARAACRCAAERPPPAKPPGRVSHAAPGSKGPAARRAPPPAKPPPPPARAPPPGPPQPAPHAPAVAADNVRVNKCFRAFASRREADRYVEEGRVRINGERATAGHRVRPGDVVEFDGRVVAWEGLQAELASAGADGGAGAAEAGLSDAPDAPLPLEARFAYLKFWKPRGVVCTTDRRVEGSLVEAVADAAAAAAARGASGRLFSVGRLDKDSTGLLLLTSDGRVPNAVLRAATKHPKLYRVTAHAPVTDAHVAQLAAGVVITTVAQRDGVAKPLTAPTLPCEVVRDASAPDRGRCTLLITLREGRNRQIRRMLDALGYDTLALHRLRFMRIGLGRLRPGSWAPLSEAEMRDIRVAVRAAGAAAGAAGAAQEADADDGD